MNSGDDMRLMDILYACCGPYTIFSCACLAFTMKFLNKHNSKAIYLACAMILIIKMNSKQSDGV